MDGARFVELCGVTPDRYGLLRWLAAELTPDDIHQVAIADCGDESGAHTRALRAILETGDVRDPVDRDGSWVQEVCELTRWRLLHETLTDAGCRQILFASTVLTVGGLPGGPFETFDVPLSNEAVVIASCARRLGPEPRSLARSLLAEGCVRLPDADPVFAGLGLLTLLDAVPSNLVDAFLAWEAATPPPFDLGSPEEWLWRLEPHFTQMKPVWRSLVSDAFANEAAARPIVAAAERWRES